MKEDSRLKDSLNKELWPMGQSSLRSDELKNRIYEDFKVFFENKDALRMATDAGFLTYDYNFYSKNFKDSIFAAFLLTIVELYRSAKKKNHDECFSFLLAHELAVSRGFQNTTDIAYTEQHKDIERLNLYSKVVFRELGDFIEGSFQPFIKELYGLHLLKKKNSAATIETVNKASLGDAVAALIDNYEDLSVIYKHVLNGVPLNQWRNIAHHNSYQPNENTNEIRCTYGQKENKKVTVLSRVDLGRISIAIFNIQYLHKIAHAIFMADNVVAMSEKRPDVVVSEDTAILQSFETLASRGFKVIDLKRNGKDITLDVKDVESRVVEEIKQSIKEISPVIFSLLTTMSLSVFSTDGSLAFVVKTSPNHPLERDG
jgi:hypothetical protein